MLLNTLAQDFQDIFRLPWVSLSIILNLILIESLLSIDNAAVLATMVRDLPKDQRYKALRYGILGAYIFRGLALIFASVLISIWWFKPLGGLYLLYLALRYFFRKKKTELVDEAMHEAEEQKRSWLYRKTRGALGPFWATVIMVEIMDAAFSIDNVIAANAYSKNIILIWTGVFIGILAMRFVATGFMRLMEKYPFLETCAYCVIALLGLKLALSGISHFYPCSEFTKFMEGDHECLYHSKGLKPPEGEHPKVWGDVITSVFSLGIFFIPILTSILFNWPKHKEEPDHQSP